MSDTLIVGGSPFLRRLVRNISLPQVVDAGRKVVPGQFTLVHFQRVFASALTKKMFLLPLRNTMIITLGLTITRFLSAVFWPGSWCAPISPENDSGQFSGHTLYYPFLNHCPGLDKYL